MSSLDQLRREIGKAVIGQDAVIDEILACLLAGGHALLEGAPGLGKTLLVRTISRCLRLTFSRIQFTPDLMPADITGTNVLEGAEKRFRFEPGPIFGNVVLADEINRATPKTQSALLEAMEEAAVTVAGERHALDAPFFVLATQNPIEMEGTYPLPEAQLDRFCFKIVVPSPGEGALAAILGATTGGAREEPTEVLDGDAVRGLQADVRAIELAAPLVEHIARLVHATGPDGSEAAKKYVRYGAGVRGGQSIALGAKAFALMDGRSHVSFADIRRAALPALRHRLILNFEGEAEGISTDRVIEDCLAAVPEVPDAVRDLT